MAANELWVCHLGRVEYREAAALQERLRERVTAGELPDLMLLLEHPPVYTIGRRSDEGDLPFGEAFYRERGIDIVRTPRGGQLTYHGPGQLVGYPIMHVAGVPESSARWRRRSCGRWTTRASPAATKLGHKHVGVWVGERKIASVGVHISHGVSSHGFAVNVTNDLDPFSWVVACGLPEVQMTSMAAEGSTEEIACFRKRIGHRFTEAFGLRQRLVSANRLGIEPLVAA